MNREMKCAWPNPRRMRFLLALWALLCVACGVARGNLGLASGGRGADAGIGQPMQPRKMDAPSSGARRAVVLTTDCGADMDDQWTLAQLMLAPELELRGVVTTHAPGLAAPAAETSAQVVREVMAHLPVAVRARPPVFAGSSVPLPSVPIAGRTQARPNAGVRFLIEQSRAFSARRRLAVLVTGAATDVASALLLDPQMGDRIEIIAMGFEKWPEGGDSWNVKNDVQAWQVLLQSRAPIVVGDAAVTRRDLAMTRTGARALFSHRGAAGRYLAGLLEAWLDRDPEFCRRVTGHSDTWVIWDQVVLAHLLGLTTSKTVARPLLRDDLRFEHSPPLTVAAARTNAPLVWITGIERRQLWEHFTHHLERANAQVKAVPPVP